MDSLPTDGALLFGIFLGGAWILREVLPLLLKRHSGSDGIERERLLTAKVYEDNEAWWHRWRDQFVEETVRRRSDIDKRLDAHAEEIKEHAQRIGRLERNGS